MMRSPLGCTQAGLRVEVRGGERGGPGVTVQGTGRRFAELADLLVGSGRGAIDEGSGIFVFKAFFLEIHGIRNITTRQIRVIGSGTGH